MSTFRNKKCEMYEAGIYLKHEDKVRHHYRGTCIDQEIERAKRTKKLPELKKTKEAPSIPMFELPRELAE